MTQSDSGPGKAGCFEITMQWLMGKGYPGMRRKGCSGYCDNRYSYACNEWWAGTYKRIGRIWYPHTKIIIISAGDDFKYSSKGVRIGLVPKWIHIESRFDCDAALLAVLGLKMKGTDRIQRSAEKEKQKVKRDPMEQLQDTPLRLPGLPKQVKRDAVKIRESIWNCRCRKTCMWFSLVWHQRH